MECALPSLTRFPLASFLPKVQTVAKVLGFLGDDLSSSSPHILDCQGAGNSGEAVRTAIGALASPTCEGRGG